MAVDGDYKVVIPSVILLLALSMLGYDFVRKNCEYHVVRSMFTSHRLPLSFPVGPTLPHTYQNPEWEAATREKLIKNRANPIEGISSRVQQS